MNIADSDSASEVDEHNTTFLPNSPLDQSTQLNARSTDCSIVSTYPSSTWCPSYQNEQCQNESQAIISESFVSVKYTDTPASVQLPNVSPLTRKNRRRLFLCEFQRQDIRMIEYNAQYELHRAMSTTYLLPSRRNCHVNQSPYKLYVYCQCTMTSYGPSIGVYMGALHTMNRAQLINSVYGSSLDTVEVLAAIIALKNIENWLEFKDEPIVVRTRCQAILQNMSMEFYGPNDDSLNNFGMISKLRQVIAKFPRGVEFEQGYYDDPGMRAARLLAQLPETYDLDDALFSMVPSPYRCIVTACKRRN